MQQSILLIEDEESLARFVELELQHEGYAVVKRFDGREGLDEALQGAYDLILLDIMLPTTAAAVPSGRRSRSCCAVCAAKSKRPSFC